MALKARMANGEFVELAADTLAEALKTATVHSLTGSLSTADESWLATKDGGAVRYVDVVRFVKEPDEIPPA